MSNDELAISNVRFTYYRQHSAPGDKGEGYLIEHLLDAFSESVGVDVRHSRWREMDV
jgi:hypothetical protein